LGPFLIRYTFIVPSNSDQIIKFISIGAAGVTLAIWTTFQDPINPIKFILLMVIAAWLVGILLSEKMLTFRIFSTHKFILTLSFLFFLSLIIAFLNSENLAIAAVGTQGRLTGLLFYIALTVVLISTSLSINFINSYYIFRSVFLCGFFLAIYGLAQSQSRDFVPWNNKYNSVITTLGNPNFSSAVMAIFAVILFGNFVSKTRSKFFRGSSLMILIFLLIAIKLSEARQGLLSAAIGIGFIAIIWIFGKQRILGFIVAITFFVLFLFSIFGMLQIGPLQDLLYKSSVSVRGYYWSAGLEMFKHYPWFGVGLDNYGAYFEEYRKVGYPLSYGFDISSNNAHNVPIQLLATAGIFVGAIYLLIVVFIFWSGINGIKRSTGTDRLIISTFMGAWLAFQSQSIISIDNAGVTIWGWMLGGAVVGLSNNSKSQKRIISQAHRKNDSSKSNPSSARQILLSSVLVLIVGLFGTFLFRGESLMHKINYVSDPNIQGNSLKLKAIGDTAIKIPLFNNDYKVKIATYYAGSGYVEDALKVLNQIVEDEPRHKNAWLVLSDYYTSLAQYDSAIKSREKIIALSPYDANNYLELGILYKNKGDFYNMDIIRNRILTFAQLTEVGKKASQDLIR
jgi:O-antigen ligase